MNKTKPHTVNKKEQCWAFHIKKWRFPGISQAKYYRMNNLALRMLQLLEKQDR